MLSVRSAVALAAILFAFHPKPTSAEEVVEIIAQQGWQQAQDMSTLVRILDGWLDRNSPWPRQVQAPRIRIVSEAEAHARRGATGSFQRGRIRGLYDLDHAEILLVRPWDPRDTNDVSVLLHELVHHRQASHHWYCPAAQELLAYRLQDAWPAERGVQAHINWVAVVLDSGCTPRDIHPD